MAATTSGRTEAVTKDTVHHDPAPHRLKEEGSWIKLLLHFFDEVAI